MKQCSGTARGLVCSMMLVVLTVGFLWNPRPAQATSIFINEIHYDNASGDVNEGVEIAGIAGVTLDGWSLMFYNGSDGNKITSVGLSGVFNDETNGFGFLNFSVTGIQNGSPDGIALVHGNDVVQFLSYEGYFTAVNDIAEGMTSVDIEVYETSLTTPIMSLQLMGTGSRYEDFTWAWPTDNTFGSVNTGQTFLAQTPVPTPEPGTFILLGLGLAGMVILKKKRD